MPFFNGAQTRAILCGFLDIHRRMAELEALLLPGTKPTPFSGYVNDLSLTEAKVIQDYFTRIRTAMLAHLRESEIPLDVQTTSLRWAIDVGISFIGINVAELGPEKAPRIWSPGTRHPHTSRSFNKTWNGLSTRPPPTSAKGSGATWSLRSWQGLDNGPSGARHFILFWRRSNTAATCRIPAGDRDDCQPARIAVLRDRGLWAGERRKVLSPESHRRCRCPPSRRHTRHRRSHTHCFGGQDGGGYFIRGVRGANRGPRTRVGVRLGGRKSGEPQACYRCCGDAPLASIEERCNPGLTPSERMAGYIREQIRRELDFDLAVRPRAPCGADESLLTRWFGRGPASSSTAYLGLVEASLAGRSHTWCSR